MSLLHSAVLAVLPRMPKPLMRRIAARYIAGESLEQALAKLAELARAGHAGILDILGEDVTTAEQARGVAREYAEAGERLADSRVDAYVSVKPTHLGLRLSEALALELYRDLARHLARRRLFLRVEMEDHTTTDATLRLFEALAAEFGSGVGIVLQSRLHRTPEDIRRLSRIPRLSVRMVKGIYLEPAHLAHVDPVPIREAFFECSRALLEQGAKLSFATHDELLGERLIELARARGLPPTDYEFQVLLGVREPLWRKWRSAGQFVRVYVPYGPQWRPYSLRRLKKNPEILGHVLRATFLGQG
jgi:proline dehydrogenase